MDGNWYTISVKKVVATLKSDAKDGLSEEKARKLQEKIGKNKLPEERPLSWLSIFFEQFKSPLIYVLVIAGGITLILKEYTDSIVIFGAVILNTIIGFFQEYKASETLRKLKKVVKSKALVIREGSKKIIDSENLVPGDIFLLKAGDKVPADGRVIEAHNLKTNEMALTGEWLPAEKHSDVLLQETPVADRDNMVYIGTIVEDGKGEIICTEIGLKTQIGKVAKMVKETKEEKTPLQKKIANFSKIVGVVVGIFCVLIFIEGVLTGNTPLEMFTLSVAVAVAAIPEGLPISLTIILALGMQRILKKKGLVRKLLAAETLGSTSVIVTDKTATLTEGRMKVSEILVPKEMLLKKKDEGTTFLAFKIAALSNEAFVEDPSQPKEKWRVRGRPTDRALLLAALEAGIEKRKLEKEMKRIAEIPFDPVRKYIATLYQKNKGKTLFVCGAPEKILGLSGYFEIDGKQEKLDREKFKKLNLKLEDLAGKGLRIVATAYKKSQITDNKLQIGEAEIEDLVFVSFIALKDPLRKGVKEAMNICRKAGMKPILATGDHLLTGKSVAQELGFKTGKENIIEGRDLDKISDGDFERVVEKIEVYARVEPRHKMRIIRAWQQKGEVVAMTGDGINDAPALKKADIGVALGSGTDVAKTAADLILLPDSFDIIIKAIEEGRAILDSIRRVITYLLSDSFSEVILIGTSLVLGLPLPILPAQILWVNLVEDGLPDIALAFEPKEKDLMQRKPEDPEIPLLTREMKAIIFIIGLITDLTLLGLFIFLWQKTQDIEYVRTMVFATLGIDSLFYVFSCKSLRRNIWQMNPFSNRFLVFAVFFGFLALTVSLYLPPLQNLLKTVPLTMNDWLIILGLGITEIILIEATKWYFIVKHETEI